jgi:predicted nucleic acid-binding protein
MTPVLVDASYLIAIYNRSDPFHQQCMRVNDSITRPMVTCEPVIAEALHMLRRKPEAAVSILASIQQLLLLIPFNLSQSVSGVAELMEKYNDTPADLADACLIQMAGELNTGDILTLDSDFRHYRWRKTKPFNLLIPLG